MKFRALRLFVASLFLSVFPSQCLSQTVASPDPKVEQAISTLRHVDQDKLNDEQRARKGKEIDEAWNYLKSLGPAGVKRLKQEVETVQQSGEKDDYFKLNAAALLWIIGRLDEADFIASIWKSTPLTAQYKYVFYTAFEAAGSQDQRALPLLEACLRDNEGKIYLAKHSLDVKWPLTVDFIWGSYGSRALPTLEHLVETSTDSITLQSAIGLLASANDVKALPRIRQLAMKTSGDERYPAIQALGRFGHPQDYLFLTSNLNADDLETTYYHVFALYEYEDRRAVPLLIPLLKVPNNFFRNELVDTLMHLAGPASFDALEQFCHSPSDAQGTELCDGPVAVKLKEIELNWQSYAKMSPAEKEKFFQKLRQNKEDEFKLKPGDKSLTHQQLVKTIAEWRESGRAFAGDKFQFAQTPGSDPNKFTAHVAAYGWVEERHILAVAVPGDTDSILDARAAVYQRLSDECLAEVRRIDKIVQRLARSQYRKEVGVSDKVETK